MNYKPLPDTLTIKKSNIQGLGLFATTDIPESILGIGWVKQDYFPDGFIRTPMGGFINHSDEPNCIKVKRDNRYYLNTIKDVVGGDELTVKYSFYKIQTESERLQEELEPLPFCPMADD